MSNKSNPTVVRYEHIRDANSHDFGFVVRWRIMSSIEYGFSGLTVDVFEITGTHGKKDLDGFWSGPFSFDQTDFDVEEAEKDEEPYNEMTNETPLFRIYMKHDGCTHMWFAPYLHPCTGDHVYVLADLMQYLIRRVFEIGAIESKKPIEGLSDKSAEFVVKAFEPIVFDPRQ